MSAPDPGVATARGLRERMVGRVEDRMRAVFADERARWSAVDARAVVPVDAVAALLEAGGKRLRPTFCLSGYLAAGGVPDGPAGDLAAGVAAGLELLHAFALIHDDVLDDSRLRRGRPTVHVLHEDQHAAHGWLGEPRRFGEGVASLAGDLAHVYADRLVGDVPPEVRARWIELREEVIVGQYLDIAVAAEFVADPELARWIAICKSGCYTIYRPLVLGATLAGRSDLTATFRSYGLALGEAFQLRDDLIDAFGDTSASGKPAGLDFDQHKMTLLLALAMRRDERVRAMVSGGPDAPADAVALRDLLDRTGIRGQVEARIDRLVGQACEAVERSPLDRAWCEEFVEMAAEVAYRDS